MIADAPAIVASRNTSRGCRRRRVERPARDELRLDEPQLARRAAARRTARPAAAPYRGSRIRRHVAQAREPQPGARRARQRPPAQLDAGQHAARERPAEPRHLRQPRAAQPRQAVRRRPPPRARRSPPPARSARASRARGERQELVVAERADAAAVELLSRPIVRREIPMVPTGRVRCKNRGRPRRRESAGDSRRRRSGVRFLRSPRPSALQLGEEFRASAAVQLDAPTMSAVPVSRMSSVRPLDALRAARRDDVDVAAARRRTPPRRPPRRTRRCPTLPSARRRAPRSECARDRALRRPPARRSCPPEKTGARPDRAAIVVQPFLRRRAEHDALRVPDAHDDRRHARCRRRRSRLLAELLGRPHRRAKSKRAGRRASSSDECLRRPRRCQC